MYNIASIFTEEYNKIIINDSNNYIVGIKDGFWTQYLKNIKNLQMLAR